MAIKASAYTRAAHKAATQAKNKLDKCRHQIAVLQTRQQVLEEEYRRLNHDYELEKEVDRRRAESFYE